MTSATWTSPGRSSCRCARWSTPASADPAETGIATPGDGTYVNSGPLNGLTDKAAGVAEIIAQLEAEGTGDGRGDLPAAGLAAEPAALLGLPDPDHPLRALWGGAGAR